MNFFLGIKSICLPKSIYDLLTNGQHLGNFFSWTLKDIQSLINTNIAIYQYKIYQFLRFHNTTNTVCKLIEAYEKFKNKSECMINSRYFGKKSKTCFLISEIFWTDSAISICYIMHLFEDVFVILCDIIYNVNDDFICK